MKFSCRRHPSDNPRQYDDKSTCPVDIKDSGEVLGVLIEEVLRGVSGHKLVTVLQDLAGEGRVYPLTERYERSLT